MSSIALTNDEENYVRVVRVLLEDTPTHLRVLFKNQYQQTCSRQWDNTSASGQFLIAHSNTANTPKHIIDVVKQGDSSLFDARVLFWCLLSSGCRLLPQTSTGGAISDRQRVTELCTKRNDVVHSSTGTLPNADFNQIRIVLNAIYTQLQWSSIVMRGMLQDPLIAAECLRIEQQLHAERLRYSALDQKVYDVSEKLAKQKSK